MPLLAVGWPVAARLADRRWAVRGMTAANGTGNVEMKGFRTPGRVARHAREAAFISDCEGYEAELFGPGGLPHLRSATLVVEPHDCFVPGVSDELRAAFTRSRRARPSYPRPVC